MDRNQELREKVLSYVKDFYESEERAPTVRMISENIEGITRSSFYKYFNGIGEL
jgi:sulfur relay (sulfurtransferase) DsrC/TusE family protein